MENEKTITRIVTIAILTIFFLILLNQIFINLVLNKEIVYRTENIYNNFISNPENRNISYAFFGDSHTENAINPIYINNSYNFALGAENYIETYYKIKKIVEKDNVSIKNIVLEIDPHTFSERTISEDTIFTNLYLYKNYLSLNDIKKIRKNDSIYKIWFEENFPVIGHGEDFRFIYFKDISTIYHGWLNNTGNFSTLDKEKILKRTYDLHFNNKKRIANLTFEYFLKILDFAKEKNISIFLIKYPQSKELNDYLSVRNITSEDYYDYIFNEIDFKGINYKLLDYYKEYFNNSGYFADSDHLNGLGAQIFSKKINNDLKLLKK